MRWSIFFKFKKQSDQQLKCSIGLNSDISDIHNINNDVI